MQEGGNGAASYTLKTGDMVRKYPFQVGDYPGFY
jgi:hypothetical protein